MLAYIITCETEYNCLRADGSSRPHHSTINVCVCESEFNAKAYLRGMINDYHENQKTYDPKHEFSGEAFVVDEDDPRYVDCGIVAIIDETSAISSVAIKTKKLYRIESVAYYGYSEEL